MLYKEKKTHLNHNFDTKEPSQTDLNCLVIFSHTKSTHLSQRQQTNSPYNHGYIL